ncbi:hypothetical protein C8J57DRAFT_1458688 [Mycena rebaudengoi]|nr:hypothetical protein C8J57DRAFT_1458688 [Mycena rebaudengoi]
MKEGERRGGRMRVGGRRTGEGGEEGTDHAHEKLGSETHRRNPSAMRSPPPFSSFCLVSFFPSTIPTSMSSSFSPYLSPSPSSVTSPRRAQRHAGSAGAGRSVGGVGAGRGVGHAGGAGSHGRHSRRPTHHKATGGSIPRTGLVVEVAAAGGVAAQVAEEEPVISTGLDVALALNRQSEYTGDDVESGRQTPPDSGVVTEVRGRPFFDVHARRQCAARDERYIVLVRAERWSNRLADQEVRPWAKVSCVFGVWMSITTRVVEGKSDPSRYRVSQELREG